MARKASIAEIYAAYIVTTAQAEPDAAYLRTFEGDQLRQDTTAFHLRRVRSDQSRSPAARHVAIERHNNRRAKRYTHSS